MSLRLRLALVVVGLVAVGLVVSDVATYTSLRSFLVSRIDQQLPSAVGSVAFALRSGEQGSSSGLPPAARAIGGPTMLPPGTYGERRDAEGAVVDWVQFAYGESTIARPDLPKVLPTVGTGQPPEQAFTVGAMGGSSLLFRALALKEREGPGTLVVAVPLSEVFQTLHRLVLVEVVLSLAVLLGLAALSWWLVSQSLRPLQHFGHTAAAIAQGDLTRRVESVDARTEVGRLGIALNSMLAQIERAFAERLASEERLRRFLADASHELRTPLTSIRGYAELFRRGARQRPEDLETSMRRIEEEAARMGVLVEEMLLLARLDQSRALEAAPVDLVAIAVDAAQDARAAAPDRSIEVEVSDPVTVVGDEVRLRQVACNLLTNALVHTPPGSPVEVAVRTDDGHAVLSVADRGPGLSADVAARIFEPFYRGDPARGRDHGGSGLGLSIVAAIASAHGGSAAVIPRVDGGSLFQVVLPLAPSVPVTAATSLEPSVSPRA